jgi:hypothetical protein
MIQGHLEKIVERPGKCIQESRKPLSRREVSNLNSSFKKKIIEIMKYNI